MQYFRSAIAVEDKADESPVTVADRETEAHIRRAIEERIPGSRNIRRGVRTERRRRADNTWIIDPIDGTRSFICGIPLFGMLLGVLAGGDAAPGVIRMPALGEIFAGCRGGRRHEGTARRSAAARRRRSKRRASVINEAKRMLAQDPELLGRG